MGLDLFGSFWGNAKKNKRHFPHHQPFTIPLQTILSHYHPAQPTHH
ncbi:MAG: hypothetical protein AVDCRST_MAG56-6812 [uncultured Cytophagales bacterium]|uniref:Uncharacterized protein n=1 Tax=uncultured Cytophagales bacterium TaxID=158755 RepID=A0A6J4KYR9_9SPHI|nr:MAG: hypothetical protein AVDCRST_MAG56-6812 [uncultured Cytophagales bacterium]